MNAPSENFYPIMAYVHSNLIDPLILPYILHDYHSISSNYDYELIHNYYVNAKNSLPPFHCHCHL